MTLQIWSVTCKKLWLTRLLLLYVIGLAVVQDVAGVAELGGQGQILCAQLSIIFGDIFTTRAEVTR